MSILGDIKEGVGVDESNDSFDNEIVMAINTIFSKLRQAGIGPDAGFEIRDNTATWDDFIQDSRANMVRTYILLQTKMLFDPPTSSTILKLYEEQANELLWRMNTLEEVEKKDDGS